MSTDITLLIKDKLIAKQKELGLTDVAFAKKLGISRPGWALVKSGKRAPREKLIRAVVRIFPEFTVDVMSYLREERG